MPSRTLAAVPASSARSRRCRSDPRIAEDVRVTPLHFVGDRRSDVVEGEHSGFLRHASMKDNLEEKIAQLVLERWHVATLDRVGYLVCFLDCIRRDRRKILFAIPRTATLGIAQPRHGREQP